MRTSNTQIVATIGPASQQKEIFKKMVESGLDVVRLNLSWGTLEEHGGYIKMVREVAVELNKIIPILLDLPGPRIQESNRHTYDKESTSCITDRDKELIVFASQQNVEYIALSFVGTKRDIEDARELIKTNNGTQKIVAKIERQMALNNLDDIITSTDAVMVARGDLGDEIPIERVPFVQAKIIEKCLLSEKPVITATQMLLSMTENPIPTRAEVTDVAYAILLGSNAVMLSEESARGKNPIEAVAVMNKIIIEAEKHSLIRINKSTNIL